MNKIHSLWQQTSQWVSSRPFDLICLSLVFFCSAGWLLVPQASIGWLILIASPYILRFLFTRKLFIRTPLDVWLIIFILTAVVGIWAAYDRHYGGEKFIILAGAVMVYYTIARQPRDHLSVIGWGVLALGGLLALAYLFTNHYQAQSADLLWLKQIGALWMKIRPCSFSLPLQPNIVGGILGVLLPIQIAAGLVRWKEKHAAPVILAAGMVVISAAGFALTSSRGAWLALAAVMILAGLWQILTGIEKKFPGKLYRWAGAAVVTLAMIIVMIISVHYSGGFENLGTYLPGANTGGMRLEIARNTLWLVDDYLMTGGGLGSFPGIYSRYMLLIPFYMYGYSHNLYLDIALEQGLLGLVAFCAILLITAWHLLSGFHNQDRKTGVFRLALAISLGVMVLHGWVDDAFYGERGTPLLFLVSGLTIFFSDRSTSIFSIFKSVQIKLIAALLIGIFILFAIFQAKPFLARLAANLGAVAMARKELADWPAELHKVGTDPAANEDILNLLNLALQWDPANRTARYRLGLIALDQGGYANAANLIEPAYSQSPSHRGIKKTLGYAYAWQGNLPVAQQLLAQFPEVKEELLAYSWWWQTQDHQDLSVLASRLGQLLP